MGSLPSLVPASRPMATLPKEERGPTEAVPGRSAETERVREGTSNGFRSAQSRRVAPRGRELMAGRGVPINESICA